MSYRANYSLTWRYPPQPELGERDKVFADANQNSRILAFLEETDWWEWLSEGDSRSSWGERDRKLGILARFFPTMVFVLDMFGESPGDIRRYYYQADQMQEVRPALVYPEIAEEKWKPNL